MSKLTVTRRGHRRKIGASSSLFGQRPPKNRIFLGEEDGKTIIKGRVLLRLTAEEEASLEDQKQTV